MRHLQPEIKVFLLSLALTVVAIPVPAQQSGMGGMGDRSSGLARAANPSGTGTMAPGRRPNMGSMGGGNGLPNAPITRPLEAARLGVTLGTSEMPGLSGFQRCRRFFLDRKQSLV
jgi:hypothetical protein